MIEPAAGVAFTLADDGDIRSDPVSRRQVSSRLGIPADWATVHQVHGTSVVNAIGAGELGQADAIFTTRPGLPLAVFTADCLGVVLVAGHAVGVAHAGWRGLSEGVVTSLRLAMEQIGEPPRHAYLGPGIGPCCFEVGPEVGERFEGLVATTSWGTTSVDLVGAARGQLDGIPTWASDRCTRHQPGHFSHRGTRTQRRMAALTWVLPESTSRR